MARRTRWTRGLVRVRRHAREPVDAAGDVWDGFVDWFARRQLSENAILLGFAVAIGALGALGVVAFYKLIDLAYTVFFRIPVDRLAALEIAFYRPILTGAGLYCAWWVMRRIGKGHQGLNVPDVQVAIARRGGDVPTRPALARTAASAITMGAGGSAGSEGPVAVLGSAIGSFLGRAFKFDPARVKVLVAAGAASGIAAAFNAPLAGAFFALEEMLGSFAVGAFSPVVVASVVGAIVSRGFFGNHPAFPVPEEYGFGLTRELFIFYPLLGVVAAVVSVFFIRTYFATDSLFDRFRGRPGLLAMAGGILVGAMVLASGGALVGYGHLAFRVELFGGMPLLVLCMLGVGKVLATSITLNAGGSGGVFTPSLYLGAVTGGAFGVALATLFPDLGLRPEAYALVGMGAVVAAATNAPITGILIVFEMTNDYAIVPPLMLTTVIAYVIARRWEPDSLYSGWLRRRGEHLEHGTDRDVLAGLRVADAIETDAPAFHENASVFEMLEQLGVAGHTDFPVIDDEGRLTGIIGLADIGRAAKDHRDLAPILVAADLAVPTGTVSPEDSLLDAVRKLGLRGRATIPVIDPASGRLLGTTGRALILALYERAVARAPDEGPGGGAGRQPPN